MLSTRRNAGGNDPLAAIRSINALASADSSALLVLVIGGAVYAMVADRRRPASAMSISQPARFSSYQTAEKKREAA